MQGSSTINRWNDKNCTSQHKSLNPKHKSHYANTISRVPTKEKSLVYIQISPKLNTQIFQNIFGGV